MRKAIVPVITFIMCFAISVPLQAQVTAPGKIGAFASILPAASFVERVAGPHAEVTVLVGAGQDPHTFDPSPKLMAKLTQARVLFTMGFSFEQALIKKIGETFKNVEVVDLQKGITLRELTHEETEAEQKGLHREHGHKHKHSHEAGEVDPHTWLDPQRAKIQARTIAETLMRIDPVHRADYEKNLADFEKDLDEVDAQLAKALAPVKGKSLFVFHPAYGYFAERYGLKQVAVEVQGKEPTAKQLARLIEQAKAKQAKVVFVEPQFSKKSAQALASGLGGAVVPLNPLAADYLGNLKHMAITIESALSSQR
jgi:zinc transport system substrate-binding protein